MIQVGWVWTGGAAAPAGMVVRRTRRWHRSYSAMLAGLALLMGGC